MGGRAPRPPARIRPAMDHRRCPRDNFPLTPTRFLNLLMDACPQCDGTWLDRGELAQILGTRYDVDPRHGLQEDDPRGEVACPGCGTRMVARWFSPQKRVKVDRCPACFGVWLDSHELQEILKESYEEKHEPQVAVAGKGKRYHRPGCRLLPESGVETIATSRALERGLTACRTCQP